MLHVWNLEEILPWKRRNRCLGSNNSSVVILTGVSTVITKGSLRGNDRICKRGLHFKDSLGMVALEDRPDPTMARDS
jgi:hypothetical protein